MAPRRVAGASASARGTGSGRDVVLGMGAGHDGGGRAAKAGQPAAKQNQMVSGRGDTNHPVPVGFSSDFRDGWLSSL